MPDEEVVQGVFPGTQEYCVVDVERMREGRCPKRSRGFTVEGMTPKVIKVFGGHKYCLTRNLTLDYHKLTSTATLYNSTISHATSLPLELSTASDYSTPLISLAFTHSIGFHLHPFLNQHANITSSGILGEEQVCTVRITCWQIFWIRCPLDTN